MEKVVLGCIVYLLEFAKLFGVMCFLLDFELKSRRCTLGFVLVFMIPAGICGGLELLTLAVYMSIAVTLLLFQGKGKILYGLIAVFSISCFDSLCTTIVMLFFDVQYVFFEESNLSLVLVNGVSLLFLPLFIWGGRVWKRKCVIAGGREVGKKWLLFVLVGEMALSFFIQCFLLIINENVRYGRLVAIVLCIGSVVVIMTMIFLLMSITASNYYRNLAMVNERLLESQTNYYEMLMEKEEETRAFRHDVRNHFFCIRQLFENGEVEEIREYLNKMGTLIENLKPTIQTGNRMLDVILNSIVGRYPATNYTIEGRMTEGIRLGNREMCTIFFNLLENAFAAADKTEENWVNISFFMEEEMWFCKIENSVLHRVEIHNNRVKTQKKDVKYHGYGTFNATKCVEQNGGELIFSCEEKSFIAEIILFI